MSAGCLWTLNVAAHRLKRRRVFEYRSFAAAKEDRENQPRI